MKKIKYAVQQWFRSKIKDPAVKLVKRIFRSKDERLLDKLIKNVNEADKRIYRTLLENQLAYIRNEEEASKRYNTAYNVDMRSMLPVVIKALDEVVPVLRSFIGVQPMSGPVALVYLLQYKDLGEQADGNGRRMCLEVVSRAVEAVSRRLNTSWTLEAQQDFASMHGIDIVKEMQTAFAHELAHEIFREVFDQLRSENVPTIDINLSSEFSQGQILSVHINKLANDIAKETRRGAGNVVLLSPLMLSLLQEDENVKFDPAPSEGFKGPGLILYAGTLNKTIKVYSGLVGDPEEVLVAYKGGSGDTDTGFIYSPYMLLMSSGMVIDPLTFQPAIRFMTRAGSHRVDNFESYYKTVRINLNVE